MAKARPNNPVKSVWTCAIAYEWHGRNLQGGVALGYVADAIGGMIEA